MKQSIPAAQERFHEKLDELQKEIHLAQVVLRRDLALLQADRLKREQAEAAERQRLAAESSAKGALSADKEKKDTVMPDADAAQPAVQSASSAPAPNSEPATITSASDRPVIVTTNASAPPPDPLFDPTPTTGNLQEADFDFDALFASAEPSGDAEGPSDPPKDAPDLKADSSMGNINFDDNTAPSFLHGLEDFANSSNDVTTGLGQPGDTTHINMLDMPNLHTDTNTTQNQQPPAPMADGQDATQSADQSNLLVTMGGNSFDDLFGLDYGDNPESTEFDDAFLFGDN
jgi:hypothetical protein